MDEQPGTSKDVDNRKDQDGESIHTQDRRTNSETSNYSSKSGINVASMDIEKSKKQAKPKRKFDDKKLRKRRTGRVEKQKKQPTRRHITKRTRRPRVRLEKKRDLSVSTLYSRLTSSGYLTPACERCGHRCCLRRYKRGRSTIRQKQKSTKKRKQKIPMILYTSENVQVGSCCKMLSPLNVNANTVEVEEVSTIFREITPEMIYEALRNLTMWRQNVYIGAIYEFIQRNYPVNEDQEALANELLEKLRVAVIVGIAKQTSIDTWTLCGALERPKFNRTHVTLFWKVYRDTMSPITYTNKTVETSKNTSDKQTIRVYDDYIL